MLVKWLVLLCLPLPIQEKLIEIFSNGDFGFKAAVCNFKKWLKYSFK